LESGYEERLRKRMQVILLEWCIPCHDKDNYCSWILCWTLCWHFLLLGPTPSGKGTIAFDPTLGSFTFIKTSFTLGELVFLDCFEWNRFFLVFGLWIWSNFWKFYLIKTSFTLGDLVFFSALIGMDFFWCLDCKFSR